MDVIIVIHVLSAFIGVGPSYFGHVLLRRKQTIHDLRTSVKVGMFLEPFPKIGGSLAVLTGIVLVVFGSYGTFMQLWLFGSLVIYILIQISAIGFLAPVQKKLAQWVLNPENEQAMELPAPQRALLDKASNISYVASALGLILFIFMIAKP